MVDIPLPRPQVKEHRSFDVTCSCGHYHPTQLGVLQGGPLSPMLSNIMLKELDKELERRGHKFVRYVDDLLIFCKSRKSYWRMSSHSTVYEALSNERLLRAEMMFYFPM